MSYEALLIYISIWKSYMTHTARKKKKLMWDLTITFLFYWGKMHKELRGAFEITVRTTLSPMGVNQSIPGPIWGSDHVRSAKGWTVTS